MHINHSTSGVAAHGFADDYGHNRTNFLVEFLRTKHRLLGVGPVPPMTDGRLDGIDDFEVVDAPPERQHESGRHVFEIVHKTKSAVQAEAD